MKQTILVALKGQIINPKYLYKYRQETSENIKIRRDSLEENQIQIDIIENKKNKTVIRIYLEKTDNGNLKITDATTGLLISMKDLNIKDTNRFTCKFCRKDLSKIDLTNLILLLEVIKPTLIPVINSQRSEVK